MPKRKETLEIENSLRYMCEQKRVYGCEEVTIGFYGNGHGNEIVDFCTMDSKGILRCYEIKVTLADLKSKAKKSWYGHYNYLVVTKDLLNKIAENLDDYIPDYVGVALPCSNSWSSGIEIYKKPKKQNLTLEEENFLKESMIRSMSYKIQKYRDANNLEKMSKLKSDLRKQEKETREQYDRKNQLRQLINKIENILYNYYDIDIDLEEFAHNIEKKKVCLPKYLELKLNARGEKINDIIKNNTN